MKDKMYHTIGTFLNSDGKMVETDRFFCVLTPYFSYIMATSFSGERSRSTRREPLTKGKQLVNFITCSFKSSAPFL
jgi:hypothetical protein